MTERTGRRPPPLLDPPLLDPPLRDTRDATPRLGPSPPLPCVADFAARASFVADFDDTSPGLGVLLSASRVALMGGPRRLPLALLPPIPALVPGVGVAGVLVRFAPGLTMRALAVVLVLSPPPAAVLS